MKNPLNKRLPRELKSEIGKYIVLFVFLAGMIAVVSGFLVASNSMSKAYDESFEKYNIEDGNFELYKEADDKLVDKLEDEKLTVYKNYYVEEDTEEIDSVLRIFKNREEINKACVMSGKLPTASDEIAIDRMYADNNNLSVGDTLTVGEKKLKISGLVALSDYSALYSNPSDLMFDAVKFGVAVMTEDGFAGFEDTHLHYSYSWKYNNPPTDNEKAKEMSENFLKTLGTETTASMNAVKGFIPEYCNQAIILAGDDISKDNAIFTVFLYIVVLIIAFIFAITTSTTISKEANVIGTLRASGYTKGELVRHYLAMPIIIMLAAAIIGNILGYTVFKNYIAQMYYASYSLPTYITLWNADAFIKTTVVPIIIMFLINLFVLLNKLSLSPLKFIRRDLKRHQVKNAFKLNTKIGIMKRFRLRVIFQNTPNYITIIVGVLFANLILLFGMMFTPVLDNYQDKIVNNMICDYQYVLKSPQETSADGAEKFCLRSLKTIEGKLKSEEATIYGITDNSKFVDLNMNKGVYISNAYAEKFDVKTGDKIKLKESYGSKEYSFKVNGVYYYPAAIAVFMNQADFNNMFGYKEDYYNGYFSEEEITDIDSLYVATTITQDDMTKTSRQLRLSMGNIMVILNGFGIIMFMLIIYLLSKIIIEKNSRSISMTKILGYSNKEINSLYIMTTTIIVCASLILTIPICNLIMKSVFVGIFAGYPGWISYSIPFTVFVKMAVMGIAAYSVIAFMQTRRVKKVSLSEALKNAE